MNHCTSFFTETRCLFFFERQHVRVTSFLPGGSQRSSSDHQAWLQASLPTVPPYQLRGTLVLTLDREHLKLLYIDKDIKAGGLWTASMGDPHLSLQGQAGWLPSGSWQSSPSFVYQATLKMSSPVPMVLGTRGSAVIQKRCHCPR